MKKKTKKPATLADAIRYLERHAPELVSKDDLRMAKRIARTAPQKN